MPKVTTTPAGSEFESSSDNSILQAALDMGVNLPFGCGNGFCGTCKAKLISGKVEYPQGFSPDSLTDDDKNQGFILCCKAIATTDINIETHEIETAAELKSAGFDAEVIKLAKLNDKLMLIELSLGDERMPFLAGQYIEFILENGKRRAFSIANAPKYSGIIELHIGIVAGGLFTGKVFNELKEGDVLRIEGPLGSFFLREKSANDIIMIAGGTGFAPIKGIIEHAIDENIKRNIHLFWGAGAEDGLYLDKLARSWADKHVNINYHPVTDIPVTRAVAARFADLANFDVYMAGPPQMIKDGKKLFAGLGLKDDRLFYDSFELAADEV